MPAHRLCQLVHRQKLILTLDQLRCHTLQLIFQIKQMSDKLGFSLEARLRGRTLDANNPEITDHSTANPYRGNDTRVEQ
jgi:hypothetical protein